MDTIEYLLQTVPASAEPLSIHTSEDEAMSAASEPGVYSVVKRTTITTVKTDVLTTKTFTVYDENALVARAIDATRATLEWPANWNVSRVGRDGTDLKGNGPWAGRRANLPFGNMRPGGTYTLFVEMADGTRIEREFTMPGEAPAPAPAPAPIQFATPKLWAVTTSRSNSDRGCAGIIPELAKFGGLTVGTYNDDHLAQLAQVRAAYPNLPILVYAVPWEQRAYQVEQITTDGTIATVQMATGNDDPSPSAAGVTVGAKIIVRNSAFAELNGEQTVVAVNSGARTWTFTHSSRAAGTDTTGALFLAKNDARISAFEKISAMNWWLRHTGTTGHSPNHSRYNRTVRDVNLTDWAPADSDGRRYSEWLAKEAVDRWSPSGVTGLWQDNVLNPIRSDLYTGRSVADYQRSGTPQSISNAAIRTAHMKGLARFARQCAQMGVMCIANADNDLSHAELKGQYDGAWFEHAMDKSFSTRLAREAATLPNLKGPKIFIFHDDREGLAVEKTPAALRFGLAQCMVISDAYYAPSSDRYDITRIHDEYDAPIGNAIEAPQKEARFGSLWWRRYENGIAVFNAGTSSQAFTERGYRRLDGSDSFNTGSRVNSLTLGPNQGALLIRAA